jgi:hypothetical protein
MSAQAILHATHTSACQPEFSERTKYILRRGKSCGIAAHSASFSRTGPGISGLGGKGGGIAGVEGGSAAGAAAAGARERR